MGAFALLAWNRFGFQALVAPRTTARILLLGLYGWFGLSAATWGLVRVLMATRVDIAKVVKLFGLAHLPVMLVAVAARVTGVVLDFTGPGRAIAVFAVVAWMPGQLVGAAREAFGVDTIWAGALCWGPYLAWLAIVGRLAMRNIGHLL